jgi:hypothetical protein
MTTEAEALPPPGRDDAPPAAAGLRGTWIPVGAFCGLAGALLWWQHHASHGRSVLGGWSQFDGPEYLEIATRGYEQRQAVWFPLYPVLIRLVDAVVDHPLHAAVGVSLVAGLVGTVLYWRWLQLPAIASAAPLAGLAIALLYPYGWFRFGVVYADALFAALCVGAFVLVERDRLLAAGVVGALATATRPSGFALALGLLILTLERHEVLTVRATSAEWARAIRLPLHIDRRAWRPRLCLPLLAWAGLAGYSAWSASAFGSPLAWVSEQRNYHASGSTSLLKLQYLDAFNQGFDGRHLATTTAQALLVVGALLLTGAVGRRFGWGYAAFTLSLAALPAITVSTFMGSGRYLLPAFPIFALLGEWLARRRLALAAWIAIASVSLATMAYGFARSWYLT